MKGLAHGPSAREELDSTPDSLQLQADSPLPSFPQLLSPTAGAPPTHQRKEPCPLPGTAEMEMGKKGRPGAHTVPAAAAGATANSQQALLQGQDTTWPSFLLPALPPPQLPHPEVQPHGAPGAAQGGWEQAPAEDRGRGQHVAYHSPDEPCPAGNHGRGPKDTLKSPPTPPPSHFTDGKIRLRKGQ